MVLTRNPQEVLVSTWSIDNISLIYADIAESRDTYTIYLDLQLGLF